MSMWLILAYLAFVVLAFVAVSAVTGVVLGVLDARAYYSVTPGAIPPDKFLVRLGLWGVKFPTGAVVLEEEPLHEWFSDLELDHD